MRHEHWIAGKATPPDNGTYFNCIEPGTRMTGDQVAAGNAVDVDGAVREAGEAQPSWAALPAAKRSEVLHGIANAIGEHSDELKEAERKCTGKVPAQLDLEVNMSAAYFRYYAGVLQAHGGRVIDQGDRALTYTRLEPYGVVGVITPWNLPLNQACRAVAPALAVGNAIVLKPSEFTSVSALQLARIAFDCGLAPGVFNVVTGTGPEVGSPLAAHSFVRRVAFTGSVRTGRYLADVAADRLIPLTLELGGKSPQVVFADADLVRAVAAGVSTVSFNTGQACSAATRLLVEESVHDEVVARVVEGVAALVPGQDFGPMITESQYAKVVETFAEAEEVGLKPSVGGKVYEEGVGARGWYVQPTVYVGVDPAVRLARDEIFGPVLVTIPFTDEADAVVKANDTDYGLVASVWSGDVARGLRVAARIEAGQVAVNGGPLTIETPFGGFKSSGYGREKGLEALDEYTQTKTISLSLD
jgi:aldehyde dehydrogenase (NAD+)